MLYEDIGIDNYFFYGKTEIAQFINYNIAIYIIVLKFTLSMEIFVKNEYVTYQETGGFVPVFIINQIKEEQYG